MQTPKYLVIDAEMTGLNPSKHQIIQIGAAVLDTKLEIMDTFVSDIGWSEYEYTEEALLINGFTHDRINSGPKPEEVAASFISFIKANFITTEPTYVGQFFCNDFAFLNNYYSTVGMSDEWLDVVNNAVIDTKSLVLAANLSAELYGNKKPFKVTSLSKPGGIKDRYDIKGQQSHDALGDVMITIEVLKKLIKELYV